MDNPLTHKAGPLPVWGWLAVAGGVVVAVHVVRSRTAASQAQDANTSEYSATSYPTSSAPVLVLPPQLQSTPQPTLTSIFNQPNGGLEPQTIDPQHWPALGRFFSNGAPRAIEYDPTMLAQNNAASGLGDPHVVTTGDGPQLYNPVTQTYTPVQQGGM